MLRSIPSVDAPPKRNLPTISGSIPHPYNRPPGCPFHTRCPDFMPGLCNEVEPALAAVGAEQKVACFLYPEVREASGVESEVESRKSNVAMAAERNSRRDERSAAKRPAFVPPLSSQRERGWG